MGAVKGQYLDVPQRAARPDCQFQILVPVRMVAALLLLVLGLSLAAAQFRPNMDSQEAGAVGELSALAAGLRAEGTEGERPRQDLERKNYRPEETRYKQGSTTSLLSIKKITKSGQRETREIEPWQKTTCSRVF